MRDPIEQRARGTLLFMIISTIGLICLWFVMNSILSTAYSLSVNETEENDSFEMFMENLSSAQQITYKNVTILDKEYRQRSFSSDVYNVVYRMEDGNLTKTNDMQLYYDVEEGKSYNVSWAYGIEDVIEEV